MIETKQKKRKIWGPKEMAQIIELLLQSIRSAAGTTLKSEPLQDLIGVKFEATDFTTTAPRLEEQTTIKPNFRDILRG